MLKMRGRFMVSLLSAAFLLSAMPLIAFAGEADTASVTAAVTQGAQGDSSSDGVKEPYGVDVALYLKESNDAWSFGNIDPKEWSEPASDPVHITKDGTYTVSLTDLEIPEENFCLCYIKDTNNFDTTKPSKPTNLPEDVLIITNEVKVNGSSRTILEGVRTGLKKGIFDVCYQNNWAKDDCTVDFAGVGTVNTVEVTFTVSGITGEPGSIEYKPTQAVKATVTVAAAAESSDNAVDTSAAAEEGTGNNITAFVIVIAIAAVIIIAGAIIFFKKKKKS